MWVDKKARYCAGTKCNQCGEPHRSLEGLGYLGMLLTASAEHDAQTAGAVMWRRVRSGISASPLFYPEPQKKSLPKEARCGSSQLSIIVNPSSGGASGSNIRKRVSARPARCRTSRREFGTPAASCSCQSFSAPCPSMGTRLASVHGVEISFTPMPTSSGNRNASNNRPRGVEASASYLRYCIASSVMCPVLISQARL